MHETPDTNKKELYRRAADTPWLLSHAPFRVAPRVYYVGNSWVGAYLVDTSDGLILIDTTLFESVYQVLESIWELGFDARDIKHIMLTHCHIDHSGGVNQIAGISGAKVWLSREDARFCNHEANLSLGKLFKLAPFEADCYYDDASPIVLGDVIVRTRLTPGHTPGATTMLIYVPDGHGGRMTVGLHGGVGVNTMSDEYFEQYGLSRELRRRFISDCDALKFEHVDVAIPSHPNHSDLFSRVKSDPMDYSGHVDPGAWARFLDTRKTMAQELDC